MSPLEQAVGAARSARQAYRAGSPEEARELARAAEEWVAAAAGEDAVRADVLHRLASVYRALGDADCAERCARACLAAERRCGRPILLANHLLFLAKLLQERGAREEALRVAREGVALYTEALGAGHPELRRIHRDVELDGLWDRQGGDGTPDPA